MLPNLLLICAPGVSFLRQLREVSVTCRFDPAMETERICIKLAYVLSLVKAQSYQLQTLQVRYRTLSAVACTCNDAVRPAGSSISSVVFQVSDYCLGRPLRD